MRGVAGTQFLNPVMRGDKKGMGFGVRQECGTFARTRITLETPGLYSGESGPENRIWYLVIYVPGAWEYQAPPRRPTPVCRWPWTCRASELLAETLRRSAC